jgi:hypothetical protein
MEYINPISLLQIWPLATSKFVTNSVVVGVANELRLATLLATPFSDAVTDASLHVAKRQI